MVSVLSTAAHFSIDFIRKSVERTHERGAVPPRDGASLILYDVLVSQYVSTNAPYERAYQEPEVTPCA